eukprot:Lithocolla_globosa_v1_NODE_1690_length_2398_cov_10.215109.p3 type:complete len:157 gc:universal NODE_1690_length_2398_cov_10.215109:1029-1499(+)
MIIISMNFFMFICILRGSHSEVTIGRTKPFYNQHLQPFLASLSLFTLEIISLLSLPLPYLNGSVFLTLTHKLSICFSASLPLCLFSLSVFSRRVGSKTKTCGHPDLSGSSNGGLKRPSPRQHTLSLSQCRQSPKNHSFHPTTRLSKSPLILFLGRA